MLTRLDQTSGTFTIMPDGRFDFSMQQDFRAAYQKGLADARKIVVDLNSVTYLDSSALGMLLVLKKEVEARQGSVTLRGAREGVRRVLEVANFEKLFGQL